MTVDLRAFASTLTHSTLTRQDQPKPQFVAHVLREAILNGLYDDGKKLQQEFIAAQLGVSRMPVRQALQVLKAEGLIVANPNRSVTVASFSAEEAQELYEMRLALEPLALRLSLPKLTKSDLGRAEDVIDEAERASDPRAWSELNWYFHEALYWRAERPRLLSTIRSLYMSADRYTLTALATMGKQEDSQREHRVLLDACRQNERSATRLLSSHIRLSARNLVAFLRERRAPAAH